MYQSGHSKWDIILLRSATLVIVCAACIAFYYFYLIFFPQTAITYSNIPFPVVTKHVHPGDRVIILMDYCKKINIIPNPRSYTLENSMHQIEITTTVKQLPSGCHKNYYYDGYIIPIGTPPGRYDIHAELYYRLNPISTYYAHYTTQTFQVLP